MKSESAAIVFTLLISALLQFASLVSAVPLSTGSGSFRFVDEQGNADRPITVWYHQPEGFQRDGKVLFVIHGRGRNASEYRDVWVPHVEELNVLLLCPEFSNEYYPDSSHFNLGYTLDENGKPRDKQKWSFTAVERIFDEVVDANRLRAKDYNIYGHSAGGQFVHRFVLFMPEARFNLAVAANSGWYTMPTQEIRFPYGLGGIDVKDEQLSTVLGRRLIVLLGTGDILTDQENLLNTPEAKAQGPHRFARGSRFFQLGKECAQSLEADFRWQRTEVPGATHSNKEMAPAAAKLFK